MYEVLSLDQLRECIEKKTECFMVHKGKVHSLRIESVEIRIDAYSDKVIVVATVRSLNYNGVVDATLIGLSEKHAHTLLITNRLGELAVKINQLTDERKQLTGELVGICEEVLNQEDDENV